jgi:antitoxin component YwqK of YwqJK toxin-antitoxin module
MSYEEIKHSDGSFQRLWRDENGKLHREYGPAIIWYYPNGSINRESFHINGILHSELGPAIIYYLPDGSIIWEDLYLNGEYLGTNNIGFWALWDRLDDKRRQNPELLKYLVRFS